LLAAIDFESNSSQQLAPQYHVLSINFNEPAIGRSHKGHDFLCVDRPFLGDRLLRAIDCHRPGRSGFSYKLDAERDIFLVRW
jgi:hypothetical protein